MRYLQSLLFFAVLSSSLVFSQQHNYNVGLRGGESSGITLRHFLKEDMAVEGLLKFYDHGFKITLMKETFTKSSFSYSNHVYTITGVGAHAGFISTDNFEFLNRKYHLEENKTTPILGLDGMLGIEYRINSFPLVLGLDWKPYFEFSGIQYFKVNLWDIGFSIKYAF